jgi:hypothetical protein
MFGALCMFLLETPTQSIASQLAVEAAKDLIPVVPPMRNRSFNNTQFGGEVELDGLNSINDIYAGVTFVYGGGAYNLQTSSVSGPVVLKLTGAAANTAHLLATFGLISDPIFPPPIPPFIEKGAPIEKKTLKTVIKGNFVSPYEGKK